MKEVNITKKDITRIINSKLGLPKILAHNILNEIFKIIINQIKIKKTLKIKNFGTFRVLHKKEREGRNPKTNKAHQINERNVVTFKNSEFFKKKLNNE